MRALLAAILLCLFAGPSFAGSVSLSGVSTALVAKAHEIERACGSSVISGFRAHARVAGSGRPSLHASGHAIDIKGNPSCIYARLQGWHGGYSTDYGAVQHVHFSLGGREDGMRFVHHGSGRQHARHRWVRLARHRGRHHRRYAGV